MERLELNVFVETNEYVYGKSEYYSSRILVNKRNKRIYEVVSFHDVCVCLIDINQTYDNLDEFKHMIPFFIVCEEAFDDDRELSECLFGEVLKWENDPREYLENELKLRG